MSEGVMLRRMAHREVEIAYGHLRAACALTDWLGVPGNSDSDENTWRNMRDMLEWFENWLNEESPFC
jgi:hypothetical protein